MRVDLPPCWQRELAEELTAPYFRELSAFVDDQRRVAEVYPPEEDVFAALKLTPFQQVRVLLLGQDPYHGEGQAHGLCFSVRPNIKPPPSLVNIFKELESDQDCPRPDHGCLIPWARQGVLLLNTVLTVRAVEPHSHKSQGWEKFTDAVLRKVSAKGARVVFVLWGNPAQKKLKLIDESRHAVVASAHPSPLSANRGFLGSRPFSQINQALREAGQAEIDWCLPPREELEEA